MVKTRNIFFSGVFFPAGGSGARIHCAVLLRALQNPITRPVQAPFLSFIPLSLQISLFFFLFLVFPLLLPPSFHLFQFTHLYLFPRHLSSFLLPVCLSSPLSLSLSFAFHLLSFHTRSLYSSLLPSTSHSSPTYHLFHARFSSTRLSFAHSFPVSLSLSYCSLPLTSFLFPPLNRFAVSFLSKISSFSFFPRITTSRQEGE